MLSELIFFNKDNDEAQGEAHLFPLVFFYVCLFCFHFSLENNQI